MTERSKWQIQALIIRGSIKKIKLQTGLAINGSYPHRIAITIKGCDIT